MYGIIDFEEQVNKIEPSELSEHLSTELGRIPWPQERDELLPKLFHKQKFVYKSDYLSDRLIEQQERAQAFQKRLKNKFNGVTEVYSEAVNRIEDRLDDKNLLPTIGLGTLAGIISWRSNSTAPLPIKLLMSAGGIFFSSLLTHQKLREVLMEKSSEMIPEIMKENYKIFDEKVGMFGANVWNSFEVNYFKFKSQIWK